MIDKQKVGYIGVATCIWFWIASFIFGALRPGYSHFINTISELGALGTPYNKLWNIAGFMVTGVLLAFVGVIVTQSVRRDRALLSTLSGILLALAGLAIAGQGLIPAEMNGGVADISSPYTRGHFISSLASGGAWIFGTLLLIGQMKKNPQWRNMYIITIICVLLVVLSSIVLRGKLPDGLAQRVGNVIFLAWYFLASIRLIKLGGSESLSDNISHKDSA